MPVKGRTKQTIVIILIILLILAIDQVSKALIQANLSIGQSIPLINNMLHITFVKNTGAAFGLFKDGSSFFIAISIIAILFILTILFRGIQRYEFSSRPIFYLSLIIIVSGALGNLFDRTKFGYVIDFIDVRIWPVFNIADSAITTGTLLLLLSFISKKAE